MNIERRIASYPIKLKDFVEENNLKLVITENLLAARDNSVARYAAQIDGTLDCWQGKGNDESRAVGWLCKLLQGNTLKVFRKNIRFPDNLLPEYE